MPRRYAPLAIALLAVVLLAPGCARPAAPVARTPSVAPTATAPPPPLAIAPAHPVVWTAHQLPPRLRLTGCYLNCPALAQSEGATAYLCDLANGQAQVWVTHDRAEHWTMAGSVPVTSSMTECYIAVDALQPRQALLRTYKLQCCQVVSYEGRIYLTTDGGVTWTPRDAPAEETPLVSNLATVGGVSYTLAGTLPRSACNSCYQALYMSKDGMRTWRRIDAGIFIQKGGRSERFVERFWLGSSGELLAAVNKYTAGTHELWRSADQGAQWSQIGMGRSGMVDPGGIYPGGIIVADGQNQRFWRACAAYQKFGDRTHPPVQQISCTLDGGATWLDTGGDNSYHVEAFAQARDGALLAVTPNPTHEKPPATLLRVTPGQSAWESLGALPVRDAPQAPQAAAGTLWLLKPPANDSDALTTVYTATYP
jgi:photosystem II stability/assembly factor-like uncharacterized protein